MALCKLLHTSYEYTFEYVYKDAVPYTVYYLAETLNDGATSYGTMEYNGKTYYKIVADKTVNSHDAIVTENFVQVQECLYVRPGIFPCRPRCTTCRICIRSGSWYR